MSNDIPAVSVIIPVYNAAEFLKDGLNSLLKQTLREIEIICVDDGSTDGSLVILKEFEKADARIRVIHQENQGAGQPEIMEWMLQEENTWLFWMQMISLRKIC